MSSDKNLKKAIWVPESAYKALVAEGKEKGLSFSGLVRTLLIEHTKISRRQSMNELDIIMSESSTKAKEFDNFNDLEWEYKP